MENSNEIIVRKCYLSVGKEVESMRNSEMDGLAAAT
jgi:hypothetical protein